MNTKYHDYILIVVTVIKIVCSQEPSIRLQHGTTIIGVKVYTDSRVLVHAFLGVPYAAPPIGKLRFAPPEKLNNRNQTIIAARFAPSCLQPVHNNSNIHFDQDEDCLYLNVWVPQGRRSYADMLSTIVFLEGDNFLSGTPSQYPLQDFTADGHDIIVVSVSYRLNVFGFYCLEDSAARGNLGLLDQYFALLWVRENIESFGGNKMRITLMGHSAGAASVVFHMTSPRTVGLFQRAVVMSGSALSPWSLEEHPINCSMAIARSLNCLLPKSVDTLHCLQSKSVLEIMTTFENHYTDGKCRDAVLPVIDSFLPEADQYLPRHPRDVLQRGDYRPVPVLTGVTTLGRSSTLCEDDYLTIQSYQELREFFERSALPSILEKYKYKQRIEDIQEIIKWRYLHKTKVGDVAALQASINEFFWDAKFVVPHIEQLKLLTLSPEPVYAYMFERPVQRLAEIDFNLAEAVFESELIYLFGPSYAVTNKGKRFSGPEEIFSRHVKKYWTDFAKKGQPVVDHFDHGQHWKRASTAELNQFELSYELPQQCSFVFEHHALRDATISIWTQLFIRLQNITTPCNKNTTESATINYQVIPDSSRPFRSAMYTLVFFVAALLILLVVCLVLLKKRSKERERDIF